MQPLNAIDAIAPAFTRTHQTLFAPFRLGRSWKLAATSYLSYCGSIFIPFPLLLLFLPGLLPASQSHHLSLIWTIGSISTILYLAFFLCSVRMEFVEFEMIVTGTRTIAPMWRRHGARALPWFGLKIAVASLIAVAFAPLTLRTFKLLVAAMPAVSGGTSDPALAAPMFNAIVTFYAIFFGVFLAIKFFGTLLSDFVLPFYTLEAIPLIIACRRGLNVFRHDPLQVVLYLAFKPILATLGFIMVEIAFIICCIPLTLLVGLFAVIAAALVHSGTSTQFHLLLVAAGILAYVVVYAAFMWLIIGLMGYLMNLLSSYAIFFLAGRYPLLANLLEPGPGAPFTPPPVFPSADERKDHDGGPPMPMDPALA